MGRLSRAFLLFALGLPLSFPSLTYRFVSPASLVLPAAGFARHLGILSCWPLSSLPWRVYTHPRCSSPAGGFLLFFFFFFSLDRVLRTCPWYLARKLRVCVPSACVRRYLPKAVAPAGPSFFLSFFPFYRSLPLSAAFIIVLESERPGRPLLKNRAREEREINRRTSEIENKERIPSRASPRGWFPHSRFFFFFFFFSLLLVGQPVAGRSNFSLFSRLKRRLF